MVVILPEGAYRDWFTAPVDECGDFLVPIPSAKLVATPVPSVGRIVSIAAATGCMRG